MYMQYVYSAQAAGVPADGAPSVKVQRRAAPLDYLGATELQDSTRAEKMHSRTSAATAGWARRGRTRPESGGYRWSMVAANSARPL
jgi:hypothetical protein